MLHFDEQLGCYLVVFERGVVEGRVAAVVLGVHAHVQFDQIAQVELELFILTLNFKENFNF